MSASRRQALPPDLRRPSDVALDHLTDPGNTVTPVNTVTRGTKSRPSTEHVRLPRAVVDEYRDAVWFLGDHGRSRLTLVELLAEVATEGLQRLKDAHNGGEDFPRRGALR